MTTIGGWRRRNSVDLLLRPASPTTRTVRTTEIDVGGGGFGGGGDDLFEHQVQQARLSRTGFYRRLAEAGSRRDDDYTPGSRQDTSARRRYRSAAGLGDESDLTTSITTEATISAKDSPSAGGVSIDPLLSMPEPHTSWRYYTSYDNGEWRRHATPVYKTDAERDSQPLSRTKSTLDQRPWTSGTSTTTNVDDLVGFNDVSSTCSGGVVRASMRSRPSALERLSRLRGSAALVSDRKDMRSMPTINTTTETVTAARSAIDDLINDVGYSSLGTAAAAPRTDISEILQRILGDRATSRGPDPSTSERIIVPNPARQTILDNVPDAESRVPIPEIPEGTDEATFVEKTIVPSGRPWSSSPPPTSLRRVVYVEDAGDGQENVRIEYLGGGGVEEDGVDDEGRSAGCSEKVTSTVEKWLETSCGALPTEHLGLDVGQMVAQRTGWNRPEMRMTSSTTRTEETTEVSGSTAAAAAAVGPKIDGFVGGPSSVAVKVLQQGAKDDDRRSPSAGGHGGIDEADERRTAVQQWLSSCGGGADVAADSPETSERMRDGADSRTETKSSWSCRTTGSGPDDDGEVIWIPVIHVPEPEDDRSRTTNGNVIDSREEVRRTVGSDARTSTTTSSRASAVEVVPDVVERTRIAPCAATPEVRTVTTHHQWTSGGGFPDGHATPGNGPVPGGRSVVVEVAPDIGTRTRTVFPEVISANVRKQCTSEVTHVPGGRTIQVEVVPTDDYEGASPVSRSSLSEAERPRQMGERQPSLSSSETGHWAAGRSVRVEVASDAEERTRPVQRSSFSEVRSDVRNRQWSGDRSPGQSTPEVIGHVTGGRSGVTVEVAPDFGRRTRTGSQSSQTELRSDTRSREWIGDRSPGQSTPEVIDHMTGGKSIRVEVGPNIVERTHAVPVTAFHEVRSDVRRHQQFDSHRSPYQSAPEDSRVTEGRSVWIEPGPNIVERTHAIPVSTLHEARSDVRSHQQVDSQRSFHQSAPAESHVTGSKSVWVEVGPSTHAVPASLHEVTSDVRSQQFDTRRSSGHSISDDGQVTGGKSIRVEVGPSGVQRTHEVPVTAFHEVRSDTRHRQQFDSRRSPDQSTIEDSQTTGRNIAVEVVPQTQERTFAVHRTGETGTWTDGARAVRQATGDAVRRSSYTEIRLDGTSGQQRTAGGRPTSDDGHVIGGAVRVVVPAVDQTGVRSGQWSQQVSWGGGGTSGSWGTGEDGRAMSERVVGQREVARPVVQEQSVRVVRTSGTVVRSDGRDFQQIGGGGTSGGWGTGEDGRAMSGRVVGQREVAPPEVQERSVRVVRTSGSEVRSDGRDFEQIGGSWSGADGGRGGVPIKVVPMDDGRTDEFGRGSGYDVRSEGVNRQRTGEDSSAWRSSAGGHVVLGGRVTDDRRNVSGGGGGDVGGRGGPRVVGGLENGFNVRRQNVSYDNEEWVVEKAV